jgi:uncharacterized membrane-anchored protein YitT (DUF2179 family)
MLKRPRLKTFTIPWNLFLISAGSLVFAIGVKAVALPQEFISGGMSGLSLLVYYGTKWLSPGIWYFIINVELKRLEEIVFDLDPDAFVIIERTYNVLGRGFSHRKVY